MARNTCHRRLVKRQGDQDTFADFWYTLERSVIRSMQSLRKLVVFTVFVVALALSGCSGGSTTLNRIPPTSTSFRVPPPVVTQGLGPSPTIESAPAPGAPAAPMTTPVPEAPTEAGGS